MSSFDKTAVTTSCCSSYCLQDAEAFRFSQSSTPLGYSFCLPREGQLIGFNIPMGRKQFRWGFLSNQGALQARFNYRRAKGSPALLRRGVWQLNDFCACIWRDFSKRFTNIQNVNVNENSCVSDKLGFVKQKKTTTNVRDVNSAGASTNVNITKREFPVTDNCFIPLWLKTNVR